MNYTYTGTLQATDCCHCHATFGMTSDAIESYKRNHNSFRCPYCSTSQYFSGKSDVEKLRESLEQKNKELSRERIRSQHYQNSQRAYKGQVTKQKKKLERIKSGVCPCCNRTFQNLLQHMKNQHPEFNE